MEVADTGQSAKTSVSVFEDDWRLIDELMQEGTINVSDDESIEPPGQSHSFCAQGWVVTGHSCLEHAAVGNGRKQLL